MSTEDNKALLRRYYDEVVNKKNRAAIDEFIDPQMVDHAAPPGMPDGIEGQRHVFSMYTTAFPDTHFTIEDLIAEGDKVVARKTVQATQHGAFLGLPPTGKLVEHCGEMDMLSMLQQLGVVPPPGQASP